MLNLGRFAYTGSSPVVGITLKIQPLRCTVSNHIHQAAKLSRMVILFLLIPLPFFCVAAANSPPPLKLNLVVILADDLGRGDYSAFGTKDIHTPNIDRIFREGMTFQNFFANSCVCSPSRASLLTGCYPDRVGVPGVIREETPDDSWGYLARDAVLLPQLLKPAGCHTAIIGKWHLGIGSPNTPTGRG